MPDDYKVTPGAVECVRQHPVFADKILIGYNRGLMVVWDRRQLNAERVGIWDRKMVHGDQVGRRGPGGGAAPGGARRTAARWRLPLVRCGGGV